MEKCLGCPCVKVRGGCTINLVKDELYDSFIKKATDAYEKQFGIKPKVYDVVIKDGARKLS